MILLGIFILGAGLIVGGATVLLIAKEAAGQNGGMFR